MPERERWEELIQLPIRCISARHGRFPRPEKCPLYLGIYGVDLLVYVESQVWWTFIRENEHLV